MDPGEEKQGGGPPAWLDVAWMVAFLLFALSYIQEIFVFNTPSAFSWILLLIAVAGFLFHAVLVLKRLNR